MSVVHYEEGTGGMLYELDCEVESTEGTYLAVRRKRDRARVRINKRFVIKIVD